MNCHLVIYSSGVKSQQLPAVVVIAVGSLGPAIVLPLRQQVQLIAAFRPHFRDPEAPVLIDVDAQGVAVAVGPDLFRDPALGLDHDVIGKTFDLDLLRALKITQIEISGQGGDEKLLRAGQKLQRSGKVVAALFLHGEVRRLSVRRLSASSRSVRSAGDQQQPGKAPRGRDHL